MKRDALTVSPQQIDPLSWFTRPLVALSFAVLITVYGFGNIIITWDQVGNPVLDLLAVMFFALACVYVQWRTRPFLGAFGVRNAIVALLLAVAGLAISTVANQQSMLLVQYWWAPVGAGLVIATLGPYSSVRRIVIYGTVLTLLTAAAGLVAFLSPSSVWPPVSAAIVGGATGCVALVATSVFSYVVVARTQSLLAGAGIPVDASAAHDDAANRVERRTVARLGARVAPFLEGLAEAGVVTDADRALAGQLARRLRSDLVQQANRSWLDMVAENGRIFVVDPDHRAERMNQAQRSALRGLLYAALRNPATDAGSLFIELRGQDDGSTAVAMSLDMNLPEGRRSMLLAPYYLALQTTVSDMTYDPARELLRFEVRE